MPKSYVDSSGIHFGYTTNKSGFQSTKYYATIVKKAPKTYGKHTAFGKRTVLKPFDYIAIGTFETKEEAAAAAKNWIEIRLSGGDPWLTYTRAK